MDNSSIRLNGQKILITSVSRPLGIGATLAKRLAEAGANVAVHGYSEYDLTVGCNNSATLNGTENIAKQLTEKRLNVVAITPSSFTEKGTAEKVVQEASKKLNGLDGLVLNHCYGTYLEIGDWTEDNLDPHFSVNIRASMLMIQAFAKQIDINKANTITLFTSGQYYASMSNEIPYCVAKEAIINLCRQSAALLGKKNVRVNCINPGANDTGYYDGNTSNWCVPDDAADLVLFLHSNYARHITGQMIASDKGLSLGAWVL